MWSKFSIKVPGDSRELQSSKSDFSNRHVDGNIMKSSIGRKVGK